MIRYRKKIGQLDARWLVIAVLAAAVLVPVALASDGTSPTTDDNYDGKWKSSSIDITITCSDPQGCSTIEWQLYDANGNFVKSNSGTGSSTVANDIGQNNNGELSLLYRGTDSHGNTESWNNITVRIDKITPNPAITGPSTATTYSDDFKVTVNDRDDGGSGIGQLEIYYLIDTTTSFREEMETIENESAELEANLSDSRNIDIVSHAYLFNNSYSDWGSGEGFLCLPHQDFSDKDGVYCGSYTDYPDGITQAASYVHYLQSEQGYGGTVASYDPNSRYEAPSEGWGMAAMNVIDWNNWNDNSVRIIIPLSDHDTNGGSNSDASNSCGDDVSYDFAHFLDGYTSDNNVSTFGMVAEPSDTECDDPTEVRDSTTYDTVAEEQMGIVGGVTIYGNTNELVDNIGDTIEQQNMKNCQYRVDDGNDGTWDIGWTDRFCPDGNFTVTVDSSGSSANCTTGGDDTCKVEVRTADTAGNTGYAEATFDIATDFSLSTNYSDLSWKDSPQAVKITCQEDGQDCDSIDWRINESGSTVRPSGGGYNSAAGAEKTVNVGEFNNGQLILEYRGNHNGDASSWSTTTVKVDKNSPTTSISDSATYYSSSFGRTPSDSDTGGSPITCDYRVDSEDDSTWDTGWQSRTCADTFNIDVGSASSECNTEGTDICRVQVRITDGAGNDAYDSEAYNIDFGSPTVDDNITANPSGWHNTAQSVEVTCDDGGHTCDYIHWRIVNSTGDVIRSDSESTDRTVVDVGAASNGELRLEYIGESNGENSSTESQTMEVDKVDPWTQITEDDTNWHGDDISKSPGDDDWGGSGISSCEYQTRNGGSGSWTGWETRSCGSLTVTVGGPGNNCTVNGKDECGAQVRVTDNAGNRYTDTIKNYNIDTSAPDTDDNYTKSGWQSSPQDIELTCTDDTACDHIDWNVTEQGGGIIDSGSGSGPLTVTVGDDGNGELYLSYRGVDDTGNIESPWNEQLVQVDKQDGLTNITGPDDNNTWYNDDITVTIDDNASVSGLGNLDLYYLPDTSYSFYDEWDTLSDNITYIENEVEKNTSLDVSTNVWGLNNSYKGAELDERVCKKGQDLQSDPFASSPYCDRNYTIIDTFTRSTPYIDWYNTNYGTSMDAFSYDPLNQPTDESTVEGWGIGMLDVIQSDPWRDNAFRAIINVGDMDTNGGRSGSYSGSDDSSPSCGDSVSYDLTSHLSTQTDSENISTFSMLGDAECDDDPIDSTYGSVAEEQMDAVGNVTRYSNADKLPEKIIDHLSKYSADQCYYRISGDGGSTWTDWKHRGCPDGEVNVSIDQPGSGADCTEEGEDQCIVQSRIQAGTGINYTDTAYYNVDFSAPEVTCDDCEDKDPVIVEDNVTFDPVIDDNGHSGTDSATVCQDENCDDTFCSIDTGTMSCSYKTTNPYGTRTYCIYTEDNLGNNQTVCHHDAVRFSFDVKGGIGNTCSTDNECAYGECEDGVCIARDLPPPGLILH